MEIYKKIQELVFPSKCLSCQKITLKQDGFCGECFSKLKIGISGGMCSVCSSGLEYASDLDICGQCSINPPYFDQALYLYEYDDVTKRIVKNLKFFDKTYIARLIANLICNSFRREIDKNDYIVFVPMHRRRLAIRFYNQAALIAKFVSKEAELKIDYTNLIRVKFGNPQATLSKKKRSEEIHNAFALHDNKKFFGKNILIIDDVFTTGATLNECARVLKKSGASKVTAITFAKTML